MAFYMLTPKHQKSVGVEKKISGLTPKSPNRGVNDLYINRVLCFNLDKMNEEVSNTHYEKIKHESHLLQQQIDSLKSQINSLPDGDFFCTRNGKYFKWYHTDGHRQTLIPKKSQSYAEQK